MPIYYDMPQAFANAAVEDVDKFNRLPFYLVKNEVELFPQWNIFDQLFGDINWNPNMGDTMKGVRPEPTPIGRALFYPNLLRVDPKKDVFETLESTETAQVRWHDYQSKLFSFLPSWQDFRDNQLSFNQKDIVRQVQVGNNLFVRTFIWDKSPMVFVAGKGGGNELTPAPTEEGNAAQTAANSKTAAWIAAQVPDIKSNLSYKAVKLAATVMCEDINAPFFEGSKNMPKPNEGLKGKYVLLGSNEAWLQFDDDKTIIEKKSANLDIVFNDFQGSLANGRVTYKCDRFPLRFNEDGIFISPQITQAGSNKTRMNPDYITATYEVAFLLGADGYRTIKVGPPPKDFSKVTKDKFWSMRWNGEIRLTDQFLIQTGSVATGDLDFRMNDDGRFLKLKGTTVHGIIGGETYNVLPILFKRVRIAGQ